MKPPSNPIDLPSTLDLAGIAAVLAAGRPVDGRSAAHLSDQAFTLWQACRHKLETYQLLVRVDQERKAELTKKRSEVPTPKGYPVPLKWFLREIVPGRTETDRMPRFRAYLQMRPGTDPDKEMSRFNRDGFRQVDYENHARWFGAWWDKKRSDDATNAANKLWKGKAKETKKKGEERLTS